MIADSKGCWKFPYGRGTISAFILSVLSYMCLSVAMWGCELVEIDGYLHNEAPYNWPVSMNLYSSTIGLFSYQKFAEVGNSGSENTCIQYTPDMLSTYEYFDRSFLLSRTYALIANGLIGMGMSGLLVATCCNRFDGVIRSLVGASLILGGIFEALMFTLFASNVTQDPHHASFYWGSALNVIGCCSAIVAGMICVRITKCVAVDCGGSKKKNETDIEQPLLLDKTPKMIPSNETMNETIMKDGSKNNYITRKWDL